MAAKPGPAPGGSTLDRLPPIAKFGVGALLVILVGALYFVVFFGDIDNEITNETNRSAGLTQQLKEENASKELYQKDLDEKARREQLAREQKKILPDESETPAFLSALQQVATISGVNLTSWTPEDEMPLEFFAKVPMKLTLKGKFHQIAKFFHGVGQLDRIINVENIQIKVPTKTAADGDDVEVEVECLATAFRAGNPGDAAGQKRRGAGH
jgi:type IV pilus assembly protein PilO